MKRTSGTTEHPLNKAKPVPGQESIIDGSAPTVKQSDKAAAGTHGSGWGILLGDLA